MASEGLRVRGLARNANLAASNSNRALPALAHLLAAQPELLVLEFCAGSSAAPRYRNMRRADVLAEAAVAATNASYTAFAAANSLQTPLMSAVPRPRPPQSPLPGNNIGFESPPRARRPRGAGQTLSAATFAQLPEHIPVPPQSPPLVHAAQSTPAVTARLQPRDLRVIDTAFEASQRPALLVRAGALVLCLPPIRALILSGRCLFFPEAGADEDVAPILRRLAGTTATTASASNAPATMNGMQKQTANTGAMGDGNIDYRVGDDGNSESTGATPNAADDTSLPFEFRVLEACLIAVIAHLRREFNSMVPDSMALVSKATSRRATHAGVFDNLRALKQKLGGFLARVRETHHVLSLLLETSEDMRSIALLAYAGGDTAAAATIQENGWPTQPMKSQPPTTAMLPTPPPIGAAPPRAPAQSAMALPTSTTRPGVMFALPNSNRSSPPHQLQYEPPSLQQQPQFYSQPPTVLQQELQQPIQSISDAKQLVSPPVEQPSLQLSPTPSGKQQLYPTVSVVELDDTLEVLLEAYLADISTVLARAKLLRGELDATDAQMNLVLASNRNRLLKVEVALTVVTVGFSLTTVVPTFFGMNVENGKEHDYGAFLGIVIGSSCGALIVVVLLALYLRSVLW